jgi:hypothetical protein
MVVLVKIGFINKNNQAMLLYNRAYQEIDA